MLTLRLNGRLPYTATRLLHLDKHLPSAATRLFGLEGRLPVAATQLLQPTVFFINPTLFFILFVGSCREHLVP